MRGLWFSVLGELGYRRLAVREFPLDAPVREISARIPITIELLDPAQLDEYNQFRGTPGSPHASLRLAEGKQCFIARHDGRIVGARWAATRRAWSGYMSREIILEDDEVYLYDAFTSPAVRGKAIFPALTSSMHKHFQEAGMRRAVCHTLTENRAAMLADTGYERVGTIGYVGPRRFRFHFDTSRRSAVTSGRPARKP